MTMEPESVDARLRDIQDIEFSDSLSEITSTLGVIPSLYEFDDDSAIIEATKAKLQEGVERLENLAEQASRSVAEYKPKLESAKPA